MHVDGVVRLAVADDVAALAALEAEGRSTVAEIARGGPAWLATHSCLGAPGWSVRLADPGWTTIVGELDGNVVAAATMRLPIGRQRPVAEIDCIYVTPEARELSLGELMLQHLLEAAAANGAQEVEANALPGDRETKNLFERAGLVARLIIVSRRLGGS